MITRRQVPLAALLAAALVGALGAPASSVGAADEPPTTRVAVSVATLWTSPDAPRSIDARALSVPAQPASWLRRLSTAERRGLNGRIESQVLYGQPVVVLEERGSWSKVAVPGQPSPKSELGYPGWIPTAQLVASTTPQAEVEAVVKRRTAWAFADPARTRSQRVLKLSYGTRLPVVQRTARSVGVIGPDGQALWLPNSRVAMVPTGGPARPETRRAIVAEARRFLGLSYLWGGTSGFGFDCSGFTHAVYAQLGITIPRDATPQFAAGRPVPTLDQLRKGDLVFFRTSSGALHHVGIYAGRGRMIHSPRTGQPVQYASLRSGVWHREFAGGRRLL